jgi:hypothetical protein
MSTSSRHRLDHLAMVTLALAGSACSSSTPVTVPADAAHDFGIRDLPGGGAVTDAASLVPDSADVRGADQAVSDAALANRDAALGDTFPAADGSPRDLPSDVPDAPAADGARDIAASDLPSADGAAERGPVCTPGANQTCNDNPAISSIWGTCIDGDTCVCNTGYVVNPSTGRCMLAPKRDASASDDGAAVCPGEYDACGCGCCGAPRAMACYYPTAGDTLEAIMAEDEAKRSSIDCTSAGCSAGTRYVCCLPAATEPPGSATYAADLWIGDLDHLTIFKSGADCATLRFDAPSAASAVYRVDTPTSWALTGASFGSCDDGGAQAPADGALGSFTPRSSGGQCLADVHVTLFAFTTSGDSKTVRIDAEGLDLGDMGGIVCR